MLMFAILAVFIAGLMVGRTPEYLGKKIEQKEVKMAMLAMLVLAASILFFAAPVRVVSVRGQGLLESAGRGHRQSRATPGAHGFTEILYAYTSGTGNNGSAFAGHQRQYALVQPDHRLRHADRPLPDAAAAAGGIAGTLAAKETGAGFRRNVPHARPAVRRPAGGSRWSSSAL